MIPGSVHLSSKELASTPGSGTPVTTPLDGLRGAEVVSDHGPWTLPFPEKDIHGNPRRITEKWVGPFSRKLRRLVENHGPILPRPARKWEGACQDRTQRNQVFCRVPRSNCVSGTQFSPLSAAAASRRQPRASSVTSASSASVCSPPTSPPWACWPAMQPPGWGGLQALPAPTCTMEWNCRKPKQGRKRSANKITTIFTPGLRRAAGPGRARPGRSGLHGTIRQSRLHKTWSYANI